jgi:hypothetical protein
MQIRPSAQKQVTYVATHFANESTPATAHSGGAHAPIGFGRRGRQKSVMGLGHTKSLAKSSLGGELGKHARSAKKSAGRELTTTEYAHFHRLFTTFDTEQQGFLELRTLQAMLKSLGICMDDAMMAAMALEFDTDGDRTINFDEFIAFMHRTMELKVGRVVSEEEERQHIMCAAVTRRFRPDTEWRWFWDLAVLAVTVYYVIRVTYEWAAPQSFQLWSWLVELPLALMLLADVAVFANTAYVDATGRSVYEWPAILQRYATSTMAADVAGALPVDLAIAMTDPLHGTTEIWFAFRALRLCRIVRVVSSAFSDANTSGLLQPRLVYLNYHVAPVCKGTLYFVCTVHVFTVMWMLVVGDATYAYVDAAYLVLYTLTLVGYGDVEVAGRDQKLYCCMLFLCGAALNGIVISKISTFLQNANISAERIDKMRETLAVLGHFDIPTNTQGEILSFQAHVLGHNLGSSHEELVSSLPGTIQENLSLFMNIKYISMVPMFASADRDIKMALAMALENIIFHPQEFIIIAGENGREMYFLGHGIADVIHPNGFYIETLRKGNFFGEIALMVDEATRTASIKTLSYCDVFRLEKEDFNNILGKFPVFKANVLDAMEERVRTFKQGPTSAPPAPTDDRATKPASDDGEPPATTAVEPVPVSSSDVPARAARPRIAAFVASGDRADVRMMGEPHLFTSHEVSDLPRRASSGARRGSANPAGARRGSATPTSRRGSLSAVAQRRRSSVTLEAINALNRRVSAGCQDELRYTTSPTAKLPAGPQESEPDAPAAGGGSSLGNSTSHSIGEEHDDALPGQVDGTDS